MKISDEAVEAALVASRAYKSQRSMDNAEKQMRAILEAAAPILLSHERKQTADAHRDAIVNRDTVDRLERELQNAKADAWDAGRRFHR
jgi:dihydropteroate synthase